VSQKEVFFHGEAGRGVVGEGWQLEKLVMAVEVGC